MYRLLSNTLSEAERSDESLLYRNLQLKFFLFGDPLFEVEESRWLELSRRRELHSVVGESNINSQYMLDLEFQNIKHLVYKVEQDVTLRREGEIFVTLLIQLDKPSGSRKLNLLTHYGKQQYSKKMSGRYWSPTSASRSPLNMGEDDANLFLNFWNLNQTFYLKGRTTVRRFDDFKSIVSKRCLNATIVEETESIGVQILAKEAIKEEMKELKVRGHTFVEALNKLKLQVRYAILALLSEGRVSLFNSTLVPLMRNCVKKGWNGSEDTATFASFLLDKMHFELDPLSRPYDDLREVFARVRANRENDAEFGESQGVANFFRQHRISVTPTLIRYSRG